MPIRTEKDNALRLDREDPLASFRDEFRCSVQDLIYLDGNSLGMLPIRTVSRLKEVIEKEWGERLIRGWQEGWLDLSTRLGGKIARLIGAGEDEVLVCDATSVNLFKLTLAALKYREDRRRILTDSLNFPSDLYVLKGIVDLMGDSYELEVIDSEDGIGIEPARIRSVIRDDTALLSFTHTYFKSSFVQDMKAVTSIAHDHGALILWDLSHSVGSLPVALNDCRADLAVGCTYKYLNGGPGSPAFLYVRRDLQEKLGQPIRGWFGSGAPFEFGTVYVPAGGIHRFLVGTPPVISMAAMEPGLDLHLQAGMESLREKSVKQTEYLITLFDQWLAPLGFTLGSPRDPGRRGSHVAVQHPRAGEISRQLLKGAPGKPVVITDFRQPDNIRLGIAPIYNSYLDIYLGMRRIKELAEKLLDSL